MAKEQVLARVEADLRRGHLHPAMQRLASLAATYPDDLEVRARRAALCRQLGNWPEAGRWGFLTEEVTAQEIAAFEKAHPGAWVRLIVLRLRADPAELLGPSAKARLARLVEQAGHEGPGPVTWSEVGPHPKAPWSWPNELPCLLAATAGIAVVALAIFGLVTLIRLL